MYHRKKDNTTIWSNCTFNHDTQEGYSYGWWSISKVINGQLIFNNAYYSSSTAKHQQKVRQAIGYDVDVLTVEAPEGLQHGLAPVIDHHCDLITQLEEQIAKKGTRATTNARRQEDINNHRATVEALTALTN